MITAQQAVDLMKSEMPHHLPSQIEPYILEMVKMYGAAVGKNVMGLVSEKARECIKSDGAILNPRFISNIEIQTP